MFAPYLKELSFLGKWGVTAVAPMNRHRALLQKSQQWTYRKQIPVGKQQPPQKPLRVVGLRRSAPADADFSPPTVPGCCGRMRLAAGAWLFLWRFMEMSSIHGFSHLTARRRAPLEYVFWAVMMVLALWGAVSVSLTTWQRYQENPTVISMERDSQEWNTSFPSATICPTNNYDEEKLEMLVERYGDSEEEQEDIRKFLIVLFNSSYESFKYFRNFNNSYTDIFDPEDYQDLILDNRYKFEYRPVTSSEDRLPEVSTFLGEMGLCYTYNSLVAQHNDPDVWRRKKPLKTNLDILTGNELDGDLFCQVMDMNSPSVAYFHGPEEIPDSATPRVYLHDNMYKHMDMSALALYTTEDAKALSVKQRRCRLPEESNLVLGEAYSYTLCRMECRMKHAFRLCQCVPFFYKKIGTYKVCDPEGMLCLADNEDSLIRLTEPGSGKKLDCDCLPTCDTINFVSEMENNMHWIIGTNLKWTITRYPDMRLKRDVLFGFTDVLVSMGGTAGLFLGCSILSFIEIVYFFTLRLMLYITGFVQK